MGFQKTRSLKKAGLLCLSTLFLALCAVFYNSPNVMGKTESREQGPEQPDKTADAGMDEGARKKAEEYRTIALFGLGSGDYGLGQGSEADEQWICSVNRSTGDIRLVFVSRDTYLLNDLSGGSYGRLSRSYDNHGAAGNAAVLETNLDLAIDEYAVFSWKAVADAVNLLGGVEIELSDAEFYYINAFVTETVAATGVGSTHVKASGLQNLDGVQAVAYMRLRLMDNDDSRTERQGEVIGRVFEKAAGAEASTLSQIAAAVIPQIGVTADEKDFIRFVRNIRQYQIAGTAGFPFTNEVADMGEEGSCVIPATLESNVKRLHQFLYDDRGHMCSGQVRKISRDIMADSRKQG